jgi:D-arabinose 1-dehydrogenase-like Zn-dependent alcohol dehydrogenase
VGTIVEVGSGVTSLSVGDRVGVCWNQKGCGRCKYCQESRLEFCVQGAQTWMNLGGGFAELMVAWAEGCTLIPTGLSDELAAPIFCAGYTVFSALRDAEPRLGERIAVLGAGGLGHLAIMYAKALGLEVTAMTAQADKRGELEELGADHVLTSPSDGGKALKQAGGVDIILATSNSAQQVSDAIAGLRPEGRLVNVGNLDGPDPGEFAGAQL